MDSGTDLGEILQSVPWESSFVLPEILEPRWSGLREILLRPVPQQREPVFAHLVSVMHTVIDVRR